MKQKDVAALIVVVALAGLFAFFICSKFISPPKNRQQEVEIVQPIEAAFNVPKDKKNFNDTATNPTKLIEIGPNSNGQPFAKE